MELTVQLQSKTTTIQPLQIFLKLVENKFFLLCHFSDLQNLGKCMNSMFPYHYLLNMKVI